MSFRDMKPRVTIGLPLYNGTRYLRFALDSLLSQTFTDFELVISDNASTDDSADICAEYMRRDDRIRYERQSVNRGAAWNFNRVVELARGTYFMWAAHDDLWMPKCVEAFVSILDADADVAIACCEAQPIDSNGAPVGAPYRGFANPRESASERYIFSFTHWDIHAAIYGLMRTETMRRTRLIVIGPSPDLLFVMEMSLHGRIVELPRQLQAKRLPDEKLRTVDELVTYLDPLATKVRKFSFIRFAVLRNSIRSLEHAKLPIHENLPTVAKLTWAYVRDLALIDVAEEATVFLRSRSLWYGLIRGAWHAIR